MSKITTMADRITFTKLFAQRSGASFAAVLNECIVTEDFLKMCNARNDTCLALDKRTGCVVVTEPKADFKGEIELFARFAWQEVFLQIQTRKRAA
jgi:hypothetical protein